jgi:hypothetical protein
MGGEPLVLLAQAAQVNNAPHSLFARGLGEVLRSAPVFLFKLAQ